MTPNRPAPDVAVVALDDLLALLSDGYAVELVPLDLLGPDRAALRMAMRHGEPIDPIEIRVPSLRAVPDGIRQLRLAVSGSMVADDTVTPEPATDEARLGMMAAMFGFGERGTMAPPTPAAGKRRPDTAAMAEAIFGAMRPARVESSAAPDRPADDAPGTPDDHG